MWVREAVQHHIRDRRQQPQVRSSVLAGVEMLFRGSRTMLSSLKLLSSSSAEQQLLSRRRTRAVPCRATLHVQELTPCVVTSALGSVQNTLNQLVQAVMRPQPND